ncbi:MAG TPA: tRNA 2-thiouridine(34) synthase MnmA [Gaiellales bacterium]|nr:tRNA 2-thiouridine(34) synthase MnmA [Gaiellales bacterium]
MYHPSVIAASLDLTRAGSAGPAAAWGEAGDPSCGDAVRIELAVTDGLVVRARHRSFACPHATAAASLACRLSEGRDLLGAATIGAGELESELRPDPHNRECVALAADALHAAIARAFDRERMPVRADRVAVAMSGGVDSAVALLKTLEAGLRPVGITLRLWIDPDAPDSDRACCSPQSVRAARSACHAAGVPHVTLDLRDRFRSQVVDDFVRGHAAGRTPNPCMRCNGSFRFDALAAFADRVGAPRLATGHYARIVERRGRIVLARGADPDKDQSYMLARVPEQILSRTWFPLGDQRKTETREQARAAGLAAAGRRESQEVCFVGGGDHRRFLERHGGSGRSGEVVTADGRVIGRHDGVHRFTPGQRKGLGVGGGEALFVLEVDPARGRVVAGPRKALARSTVTVRPGTMVLPMGRVQAKLRYRSPALPATVREVEGGLELELDEPAYGVAPGQAAVLYDGDVIVGGGVIAG